MTRHTQVPWFNRIHGLRNVGQFKLYEKHRGNVTDIFISLKKENKLQRVRVTRETADKARALPKANFAEFCQQVLEGAKRSGSALYFER